MPQTGGDRAVVLGGSIAGLLAARVLADTHAEVVVVERDELSHSAGHRRGVPQSRHIHGLLARGQQALEELFDGFTTELVDLGAPTGDMLQDLRVSFGVTDCSLVRRACWHCRPAGHCSRPSCAHESTRCRP